MKVFFKTGDMSMFTPNCMDVLADKWYYLLYSEPEIPFICVYALKGMCRLDFMLDLYYDSLAWNSCRFLWMSISAWIKYAMMLSVSSMRWPCPTLETAKFYLNRKSGADANIYPWNLIHFLELLLNVARKWCLY